MAEKNLVRKRILNQESIKQLKKAYMGLFNGLVQMYCERGMQKGAAWYKAMGRVYEIISQRKKQMPQEFFTQLATFFNSHRQVLLKKSMLSAEKDEKMSGTPGNATIKEEDLIKAFDNNLKKILYSQYNSAFMNMGQMAQMKASGMGMAA